MKILAWMQHKLTGRNGTKQPCRNSAALQRDAGEPEETGDWPHGLLAIGTLGSNGTMKQAPHPTSPSCGAAHVAAGAPHCLDTVSTREAVSSNTNISKRSLSFLVKKVFVCRDGFSLPPPSSPRGLVDPVQTDSTMEKILRAILNKKIYPQNQPPNPAAAAVSKKMYLKNRQKKPSQIKATEIEPEGCEDHETYHKLQITDDDNSNKNNNNHENPSKWDKTDSEYIVLEI